MDIAKKYLPIGAVAFAGASLAGMATKDKGMLTQVLVGVIVTGAALWGGTRAGLIKV